SSNESNVDEADAADALTDLSAVLRSFQRSTPRPGILFLISDFLDPKGFQTEMKLLVQRGFDVNLIQVLASEELQPQVAGDLLLVDSESSLTREITVNERVLAAYHSALAEYTTSLEAFCRS